MISEPHQIQCEVPGSVGRSAFDQGDFQWATYSRQSLHGEHGRLDKQTASE